MLPSFQKHGQRRKQIKLAIQILTLTPSGNSSTLSTIGPIQKRSCIASWTVNLTGDSKDEENNQRSGEEVITRRSSRLALISNLSISSPEKDGVHTSTTTGAVAATEKSPRKRLWNSEMANSNHTKFREQIKADIEKMVN